MKKHGIVAFAFGAPHSIKSNQIIAGIAEDEKESLMIDGRGGDVFTQKDIKLKDACYCTEEEGNPPPTLRIARGAVKWAMKKEIDILWVTAARPHLWRCKRDLIEAVKEINLQNKITVCECIIKGEEWFCKDSTQPRTRSWWNWWSREIILLILPFWIYKKIAS